MIEKNGATNLHTGRNAPGSLARAFNAMALSMRSQEQLLLAASADLHVTNRALRLLSACNQTLIRATAEEALLTQICQLIVTVGAYPFAWIGLADDMAEGKMRPHISAGVEGDCLQELCCVWGDEADSTSHLTAMPGGPVVVPTTAVRSAPAWQQAAAARGYQAIATFPLNYASHPIGVLAIYADNSDAFAAPEINLLQEMADDVAFGVATLRTAAERQQLEAKTERLTAQLQQAQRMESIGLLAGGIAHDFNNVLVPILAYAELGSMSLAPGTPARDKFERIYAAAERAAALTRQILAVSRRQVLQIATINPNEVIAELNKMLCRLIREDITVNLVLTPDVAPINADRTQTVSYTHLTLPTSDLV